MSRIPMTPLERAVRILSGPVLALGLCSTSGCDSEAPSGRSVELEIRAASGEAVTPYRVIQEGGSAVTCSNDGAGTATLELDCRPGGVVAHETAPGLGFTIKARGFEFVTHELSRQEIDRGSVRIELTPLPEFQVTNDFRSGISVTEGEEAFADIGVQTETELGTVHSVKFYVADLQGTPTVYFQNTKRHPLHYDFARLVLGVAGSREQFAARTYQGEDRTGLAGTLLYYPDLRFESEAYGNEVSAPVTLEFFPSDDLSPELALVAHRLIEERLLFADLAGPNQRLTYVPAGSTQERALTDARARFHDRDVLFAQHVELYSGVDQQILNLGVAYGTLRRMTPEELETEVVSFRDIVVLPRLPIDLPLVGGTITEELQTPLAHVNLAARARGTPNLSLKTASEDARVAPLLGKLVRFEVGKAGFSLQESTLEEAEAFWKSLARDPLVPEADTDFVGLPGFEELTFEDSKRVGVKAANLAELRRLLGEIAPIGFAVPFSAYDEYMATNRVLESSCAEARADCEEEGRRAELCDAAQTRCSAGATEGESFFAFAERLLADPELAVDTALREACVDALRFLVKHGEVDARFANTLDARVAEVFGTAQVRLRSSTNAEDLPGFSGAGLYESVSAEGDGERRPSRRIRDVWASVWLWRAFEERQFWNIDSRAVRMAVAVNPAIDDEAVNGVLITQNLLAPNSPGHYVNVQLGEIEVANPEGGAVPEVFSIIPAPEQRVQVLRQRFSSLSPGAPLLSDAEIQGLAEAADRVQTRFAVLYDLPSSRLALDLEFKLYGPERKLLIKQARPYARAETP